MRKTLTVILSALAIAGCAEKPSRDITVQEESKAEEVFSKEPQKVNLLPIKMRSYYLAKSFDELLAEPTLTVEDFLGLIQYVEKPSDLETIIKTRNIHYAKKGTDDFKKALDTNYGPPLQTHNLGSGVCDELAMYSLPFLLNMPEVKNITLIEINSPKQSGSDELPSVLVFQDRRGRWHPSNGNKPSVKESYIFQQDAAVVGLRKLRYTVSGNVTTSPAQDQSETTKLSLPHDYKIGIVIDVQANKVIKEEALHALVVFQDKNNQWHFYSNEEFSTKTYSSAGEATIVVATEIGYLHPESLSSIRTREITNLGSWLYDAEEAKKLRPSNEACLP